MIALTRIPGVTLAAERVTETYGTTDTDKEWLEAVIYDAHAAYVLAQEASVPPYAESDDLDQIAILAKKLHDLMQLSINRHLMVGALMEIDTDTGMARHDLELIVTNYDTTTATLGRIATLAPNAHRIKRRGRPEVKADLKAAYKKLMAEYRRRFPGAAVTSDWIETSVGVAAGKSDGAAHWLLTTMGVIDPGRPRLAEELRAIMAADITHKNKNLC